ncbi:RNA polymerase II mediator complex subunit [Tilletia horrida]|nr:RNA polymerase II mediator complex subunit [Tilletia horrida]
MSRDADPRHRPPWQGRPGSSSLAPADPSTGLTASALHPASGPSSYPSKAKFADARSEDTSKNCPTPYSLEPLPVRPYLHPYAAGLATPDFYPATADQPEFSLDPRVTREGFQSQSQTNSEAFSVRNIAYERLSTPGVLSALSALLHNVVHLREPSQAIPSSTFSGIKPHSFRAPGRVTLNDLKLGNYIRQLADPSIPLHRLARSVPHGSKGERLLDMLWLGAPPPAQQSNHGLRVATSATASAGSMMAGAAGPNATINVPSSVPVERAIWFIRVVGASEIQSARNRSTNYTVEWSVTVTSWLSRQLQEVSLPVENKSGGNQTPSANTPGRSLTATSPAAGAGAAALSSPVTGGLPSPSTGPPSPVQPRNFGPPAPLSRAGFWNQSQTALSGADSPTAGASQSLIRGGAGPASGPRPLQQPSSLPRWIAKWTYGLSLVRALLTENLLDAPTLFIWLADVFKSSDAAQAGVLIFLLEEVLEDILGALPRSQMEIMSVSPSPRTWWPQLATGLCERYHLFSKQLANIQRFGEDPQRISTVPQEASLHASQTALHRFVLERVRATLVRAFDLQPYLYLNPIFWMNHGGFLEKVLSQALDQADRPNVGRLSASLGAQRRADLAQLRNQCDRLLNGPPAESGSQPVFNQWIELQNFVENLDKHEVNAQHTAELFDRLFVSRRRIELNAPASIASSDNFFPKVKLLLTWACRTDAEHLGDDVDPSLSTDKLFESASVDAHRPFLAAKLLAHLTGKMNTSSRKGSVSTPKRHRSALLSASDLQPLVMRWLTEIDEAQRGPLPADTAASEAPSRMDHDNPNVLGLGYAFVRFDRLLTLLTELERIEVFSFHKFLQRLTARGVISRQISDPVGDTEAAVTAATEECKHSDRPFFGRLLRSMPVLNATAAQSATRRLAIYGSRRSESREEAMERRTLRQLRSVLGWLYDEGSVEHEPEPPANGFAPMPFDMNASLGQTAPTTTSVEIMETDARHQDSEDDEEMGALFSDDAESEYEAEFPTSSHKQNGASEHEEKMDQVYFFRCSRFTQLRVLTSSILPRLEVRKSHPRLNALSLVQVRLIVSMHIAAAHYVPLAQILCLIMDASSSIELLRAACNVIVPQLSIWQATGTLDLIRDHLLQLYRKVWKDELDIFNARAKHLQLNNVFWSPESVQSERAFTIAQCAWAWVRLGYMDAAFFTEHFDDQAIVHPSPDNLSLASSLDTYFDRMLNARDQASDEMPWEMTRRLDVHHIADAAKRLIQSAVRHVRTASVTDTDVMITHLLRFSSAQMTTLDEHMAECGDELWSTESLHVEQKTTSSRHGRVSFRAHRNFVAKLISTGCVSAEVVIRALVLPSLKRYASEPSFADDLVARTAVATGISVLRTILLTTPPSPHQDVDADATIYQRERALLLQPECMPLLMNVFMALTMAGSASVRSTITSRPDITLRNACATLQRDLSQDPNFRAAVAKTFHSTLPICRQEMDQFPANCRLEALTGLASLIGPLDLVHERDLATVQQGFDLFTAARSVTEIALAFEYAPQFGSQNSRLPSILRLLVNMQYSSLCLERSGTLIDRAFKASPTPSLLASMFEAALLHILQVSSDWTSSLALISADLNTISNLLRRSSTFSIAVNCGSTTDALLPVIQENLKATVQVLHSSENGESGSGLRQSLTLLLTLIRQVLRTSSFWTALARQRGPQLLGLLVTLIPHVAMNETVLEDLLGTVELLVSEMPVDAQNRLTIANALTPISTSVDGAESADSGAGLPLPGRLFAHIQQRVPSAAQDPYSEGALHGTTIRSIVTHHRFDVQPDKPWDHLELIPPPPDGQRSNTMGVATPRTDTQAISQERGNNGQPIGTELQIRAGPMFEQLTNAGSLSLNDFGAKRMKDQIVLPASPGPFKHESSGARPGHSAERSYGEGLGGEPVMARDMQMGLLTLGSERKIRSSMTFKLPPLATQPNFASDEEHPFSPDRSDGEDDGFGQGEIASSRLRSRASSAQSGSGLEDRDGGERQLGSSHRKRKRSPFEGERKDDGHGHDEEDMSSGLSDAPSTEDDLTPTSSAVPISNLPQPKSGAGGSRRGRSTRGRSNRLAR